MFPGKINFLLIPKQTIINMFCTFIYSFLHLLKSDSEYHKGRLCICNWFIFLFVIEKKNKSKSDYCYYLWGFPRERVI